MSSGSFGTPHTRTGALSLYGPPPWHLTGRCLAVWFRVAEPAALRNHIHERLELGPDPVVGARFWDLRHDAGRAELVRERGSLFAMREASIAIPVQFEGASGDDTVYMWADEPRYAGYAREVMGWPVIPGAVQFVDTPAAPPDTDSREEGSWPRPRVGDVVSANLTYEGRPTMSLSISLSGEIGTGSERSGPQWITHRFFPDVLGAGRVDQIVMTKPGSASLGPIWAGEADFQLTGAPGSGLADLAPVSIERAELWSELNLTIANGHVLRDLAAVPSAAPSR